MAKKKLNETLSIKWTVDWKFSISRLKHISALTKKFNTHILIMKQHTLVSFALLAIAVSVLGAPQDKSKGNIGVKAPSPIENCGCQCHHYTWRDTYGKIQVTAHNLIFVLHHLFATSKLFSVQLP